MTDKTYIQMTSFERAVKGHRDTPREGYDDTPREGYNDTPREGSSTPPEGPAGHFRTDDAGTLRQEYEIYTK